MASSKVTILHKASRTITSQDHKWDTSSKVNILQDKDSTLQDNTVNILLKGITGNQDKGNTRQMVNILSKKAAEATSFFNCCEYEPVLPQRMGYRAPNDGSHFTQTNEIQEANVIHNKPASEPDERTARLLRLVNGFLRTAGPF
ncbi:hypothetical protein PT974_00984 [Cladobotryum mycophilum]|uniref:Uncharacterized protein n=1 Tax=Cladobotryum mycophilum TaxID=491253 RepID=A0ABR0T2D3_9HYPO